MTIVDRRISLLFAAFLLLLTLAFVRAFWLGAVRGDSLARAANTQQVVTAEVPAQRGLIVDREGVDLAVSEPADDVSATPYLVKDPVRAAARLAPILGIPSAELTEKLSRRDTGFVYLARRVAADKADRVERLKIEGIDLTPGTRRVYPRDWLATQVLGTVGTEGHGLAGIEYLRDEQLHGTDGRRRTVRDAKGEPIETTDLRTAKPGENLELTLDAALQSKVESVLGDVGERYRPKSATAIVMDPKTSEVLAMANWPRVNANDPGAAPPEALQNRAVGLTYEPGSTFKAFTVAGALEDGKVTPDTQFNLPPQIVVADRTIGESHPRGPITLSTAGILAQSSNVGSILIGQRLGKVEFDRWVRRFGFGTPTGVDLPGEERGIVPRVNQYSGSSMGNLPIGQGLSVTPLQMTSAYAAIANGGVLRSPQIIRAVNGRRVPRAKGTRIISRTTSAQIRSMLEGVFAPGGTAAEVAIPGYKLAGKTGTANKVDTKTGEYSKANYIASFTGFAPAARPELLVSVIVDEPKGEIYGGKIAAPAFGKITEFALTHLRVPPS
ncbi:peptidoglycan D,D-transpeptidase FtsI family protein [Paraconexibacter algicola]|uniref:Penicillin-binding protein 2 n=1 Tax=Paraconexibacter algicola TaxID=2133960 RepID=A0A2T4UDA3_9ACTN|nr:penicillin-binding protein 2 [Paraconexibacter algicola]PTL55474.1 penicillin-binding protein 2 [Paraconexibacter algicola]